MNATITNVELKELPAPIDKILFFVKGDIKFQFTVTDNILLKAEDGDGKPVWICNVYKEVAQIIGRATKGDLNRTDSKQVRLESEQFVKKDFNDNLWQYWIDRLIKVAEEKLQ